MQNEIISNLEYFGLDEIDSRIYTGLLQLGPVSVGTMAAKLEVDRGKAYRSLTKLKNLGIVSTTFTNPTICTAAKPGEALNTIIDRKEDEIITMKNLSKKIMDNLKNVSRNTESPSVSSLSIIQGRPNIYSRVGKLIQNSTSTVYLVSTIEDLTMMYHTSIPEKIQFAKENGIDVFLLTEINSQDPQMAFRLGATEVRLGHLPSKSRMVVENKKQLLMSGAIGDLMNLKDENDSILYTNSSEMVNNMYSLCSLLWKKSKKLEMPLIKKRR